MTAMRSLAAALVAAALVSSPAPLLAAPQQIATPAADATTAKTDTATAPVESDDAEYYQKAPNAKKTKTLEGRLVFDSSAKVARFVVKGQPQLEIPYAGITGMLYERAATPRYAEAILLSPLFLFVKSKKHFLTIQYRGAEGQRQFALLRLDKKNYQMALATAEAQTGVKIERAEEK